MKHSIALFMILIILSALALPASAADNTDIMPLFDYIDLVYADLSISNWGVATCSGEVISKQAHPVEIRVLLQQYNNGSWVTIESWSATGTSTISCTQKYAVYSGYTYRVYVTGYVYNSSGSIIETGSTSKTVYY